MFALIENGIITSTVAVIPDPPNPIPAGYAPPDYRPVVDGQIPPHTNPFSDIVITPVSAWIVEPMQVIRSWIEVVPTLADSRRAKERQIKRMELEESASGITVTRAPYGAMTFAINAVTNLLVCERVCDLAIRRGGASEVEATRPLLLADGSTVIVTCGDALSIIHDFLTQYDARQLAHEAKVRAARTATTIEDLNAIE